MSDGFETNELQSLFIKWNQQALTMDEQARLEVMLTGNAEARKQWFLFCDVETGLKDWAYAERERQIARPINAPQPRSVVSRFATMVGLCAAILIVVAFAFWMADRNSLPVAEQLTEVPVREVALLSHAMDAIAEDGSKPVVGSMLSPDMIDLRSGAVLIQFFSGTSVVIEGPARFEILSTNHGRLHSGKLNAHVPPQSRGFKLQMPEGEIIDHGTDFGVNLSDEGRHELHAFDGCVQFQAGSSITEVETGEAIDLGAENYRWFDADRSVFLAEQELIRQSELAAKKRLAEWRRSSDLLSRDPATRYHLRFDELDGANANWRRLIDRSSGSEAGSGGNVIGGQADVGRWHGKGAVRLHGSGDRIRFEIQEPMQQLSLLTWVNIQSLPRWQNALLSADGETPGSVRWHLTKRGQLRLEIARDLGRPRSDWEAVESQPFLNDGRQRRWIMLTSTFDGTTIRHYANGELVGQGASFTPEKIHIGTAEIGNWSGETRRDLHAVVDEFVILDRVLSQRQIAEIHAYGAR